ncbi:MAG: hypothetical protein PGN21_02360 [Sphingomonas paucimobilis]
MIAGLIFWHSDKYWRRTRVIAALILAILGWLGIFLGLALSDMFFMQSETVAYAWMGICAAILFFAVVIGIPAMWNVAEQRTGFGKRR